MTTVVLTILYPEVYGTVSSPTKTTVQIALDANGLLTAQELVTALYKMQMSSGAAWVPCGNRIGVQVPNNPANLVPLATDLYANYINATTPITTFTVKNVVEYTASWDTGYNLNNATNGLLPAIISSLDTFTLQYLVDQASTVAANTEQQWVQLFQNHFIGNYSALLSNTLSIGQGTTITTVTVTSVPYTIASGQGILLVSGSGSSAVSQTVYTTASVAPSGVPTVINITSAVALAAFTAAYMMPVLGSQYSNAQTQAQLAFGTNADATTTFYGLRLPSSSTILANGYSLVPSQNYLFTMVQRYVVRNGPNGGTATTDYRWDIQQYGRQSASQLVSASGVAVSNGGYTVPMLFQDLPTLSDANLQISQISAFINGTTQDLTAPINLVVQNVLEYMIRVPGIPQNGTVPAGYNGAYASDQIVTVYHFVDTALPQTVPSLLASLLNTSNVYATTTAPYTASTKYTSIAVTALPFSIPNGNTVLLVDGANQQAVQLTADAAVGATTLSISNAYAFGVALTIGTQVVYGPQILGNMGMTLTTAIANGAAISTIAVSPVPYGGIPASSTLVLVTGNSGTTNLTGNSSLQVVVTGAAVVAGSTSITLAASTSFSNTAGFPVGTQVFTAVSLLVPSILRWLWILPAVLHLIPHLPACP